MGAPTCGNCLFALAREEEAPQDQIYCRRFPPRVFSWFEPRGLQMLTQFPILGTGAWCGEHRGKKEGALQ